MLVADNFDVRQATLDDGHLNNAIDNSLVWQYSTGVNVTVFNVMTGQCNAKIFEFTEEVATIEGASANQTTIEKVLPLQGLEPGEYTIRMKVTDRLTDSVLTPEATFRVR